MFRKLLNCATLNNLIKDKLCVGCFFVLVSYLLTVGINFLFTSIKLALSVDLNNLLKLWNNYGIIKSEKYKEMILCRRLFPSEI